MWPRPDDPAIRRRMQAAHALARRTFRARSTSGRHQAWGWRGRTLGRPVATHQGLAWLRLHSAPIDHVINTYWDGAIQAQHALPPALPRPRLLGSHDWTDPPWAYRAELHDYVTTPPIARRAVLTTDPDLPATWWTALRDALDATTATPTDRITLQPGFLAWAMPHYLGDPVDNHDQLPWTTAHGDLHYANLCGPDLHILDWEGWGTAPAAYDAATLHSYSLLVPTAADRVRHELADLLDSPAGRFAELAVITELLHTTSHGTNLQLAKPLRDRATHLLDRPVPTRGTPTR